MKNFDFIQLLAQHIPSFSQLHAYCDKAEIFQSSFPEESATNARKALEWLVKNHLAMASVTLEKHETLNEMLKRPGNLNETYAPLRRLVTMRLILVHRRLRRMMLLSVFVLCIMSLVVSSIDGKR